MSDRQVDIGEDARAIDGEHHVQVGLIDALQDELRQGGSDTRAVELLERFCEYTRLHFLSAELLMRRHAYSQYAEHVQEHQRMLEDLERLEQNRRVGQARVNLELVESLRGHLLAHIGSHDTELTRFIAGVGASESRPGVEGGERSREA